jgi:hypothetical protein
MISRVGENRFSGIEIEFPALIEYIKKKNIRYFWSFKI